MAGRKVVNQAEAEVLLAKWRAEAVDFRVFCRERGLDGRSLQCWRMNLTRRAGSRPVRLLELTLPEPSKSRASYRVTVGDFTVEVGDDFREDTLGRLLGVFAAAC